MKALKTCAKLLEKNDENKELSKWIDSSEGYLKARFKTHCSYDDSCSSHCIKHALSHPTDKDLFSKCDKIHNSICAECLRLIDCIDVLKRKVIQLPSSHRREVALYEIDNAQKKIINWQKHIMRGVQQAKARVNVLQNLDAITALWIRDFAQKYLPTKVTAFLTIMFLFD